MARTTKRRPTGKAGDSWSPVMANFRSSSATKLKYERYRHACSPDGLDELVRIVDSLTLDDVVKLMLHALEVEHRAAKLADREAYLLAAIRKKHDQLMHFVTKKSDT